MRQAINSNRRLNSGVKCIFEQKDGVRGEVRAADGGGIIYLNVFAALCENTSGKS